MEAHAFNPSLETIDLLSVINLKEVSSTNFKGFQSKVFQKNEYIYRPDSPADRIFLIESGRIKIGTNFDCCKEIIKNIVRKGEIFGEFSLLGQARRKDFAQAMEETKVYVITIDKLLALMPSDSTLSFYLMKILGSRLMSMEQRLESLVFKNSRTRIIDFLEEMVTKRGQRVGYEMLVRQFLTHQEIANMTATSRQTVTTVLNELRSKNILTFNRRRLLIRDMEMLKAEAA